MSSIFFQAEHSWEGLLQRIETGGVIPVVGQDLLVVDIGGKRALFYEHLAEALIKERGLSPAKLKRGRRAVPGCTLNEIFQAVKRSH